jgi:hypothetical protein
MKSIVTILLAAAARRNASSIGPVEGLGIGFSPTGEEISLRRERYAAGAAHLRILCRKAERISSQKKALAFERAVHRVCSGTSYEVRDHLVESGRLYQAPLPKRAW